jgi:hypothetical protein
MLSTNIKLYILGTQHQTKIIIIEKLKKDEQHRPHRKLGVIWYFKSTKNRHRGQNTIRYVDPLKNLPCGQINIWYIEPEVDFSGVRNTI